MLVLPSKYIPNPTTPASPLLGQSKSLPSHLKHYNSFQTGLPAPTLTPSSPNSSQRSFKSINHITHFLFKTYQCDSKLVYNKIQAKCLQALPDRVIMYLSDIFYFSLLTLAPAALVFFLFLGHTRNLVLLLSFCPFSSLYQQALPTMLKQHFLRQFFPDYQILSCLTASIPPICSSQDPILFFFIASDIVYLFII